MGCTEDSYYLATGKLKAEMIGVLIIDHVTASLLEDWKWGGGGSVKTESET